MTVSLHTTHVNNRQKQLFNGRKEEQKQKEEEGIAHIFISSPFRSVKRQNLIKNRVTTLLRFVNLVLVEK